MERSHCFPPPVPQSAWGLTRQRVLDATVSPGQLMRLVGQLSNPSPSQKRAFEAAYGGIPARMRRKRGMSPPARRLGNGVVQRAIARVLVDGQPMKLADIRTAVEEFLGESVSIESVGWCLRVGSRKETPQFSRPARGFYQLRPQT